jgi:tRNA-2-methylthio-N6-dimethylallyladenosine synthase
VAQAEGEEIFKRSSCVDMVVGPQSFQNLPELIAKAARDKKIVIDIDFPTISKFDSLPEVKANGVSAFLSIQEGCNEFCKFCVVPYTRGEEYSRPTTEIYREALSLASQGVMDVTLLGQNVNAYNGLDEHSQASNLGKLIKMIAKIDGIKRIRYMTSHPRSMHDDLIDAHGTCEKLMPFLHLPVQSGSNKILKSMNRKHTIEEYLIHIEALRKIRPDMAFSSDFIVGYPGETEEDFKATMKIVEEVNYAQCYSFKYSPRPGTPAAIMTDQIPEDVKSERLLRLQNLIAAKQSAFNQSWIGREMEILFEKNGKYPGQVVGKSPYMQAVHLSDGAEYLNQIIKVKITKSIANSLDSVVV